MTELKDGGTRHTFNTGAKKEPIAPGKGAYHLLPTHPIRRVAEIYRKGAEKYGQERNWEKGIPLSTALNSAYHHLSQFHEGQEDEDHLHQCIWWLFCISHNMEMIRRGLLPETLNDLPSYGRGTVQVHESLVCDKWRADRRFVEEEEEKIGAIQQRIIEAMREGLSHNLGDPGECICDKVCVSIDENGKVISRCENQKIEEK